MGWGFLAVMLVASIRLAYFAFFYGFMLFWVSLRLVPFRTWVRRSPVGLGLVSMLGPVLTALSWLERHCLFSGCVVGTVVHPSSLAVLLANWTNYGQCVSGQLQPVCSCLLVGCFFCCGPPPWMSVLHLALLGWCFLCGGSAINVPAFGYGDCAAIPP